VGEGVERLVRICASDVGVISGHSSHGAQVLINPTLRLVIVGQEGAPVLLKPRTEQEMASEIDQQKERCVGTTQFHALGVC
jgi:hypothetical protein